MELGVIESDSGAAWLRTTVSGHAASTGDAMGQRIGNYRIVREIGSGGCGSVWLAEHQVIGTKVAIKILRPEISALTGINERFITEARSAATIASPHVVRYIDIGRLPSGEPYAIMEYLEGETLQARIDRCGTLPVAEAIEIARQAALALALAHDANIVHRDIKPDNIFLEARPGIHVKLLDFGIAKLIGTASEGSLKTECGLFVGTMLYCAPEQLYGAAVAPTTDVYALGATLYHMLVGAPPFDGEVGLITRKISHTAPRVSASRPLMPAVLDQLVASMLATEPGDRPGSMQHVDRALAAAATPQPSHLEPELELPSRGTSRSIALIAGILTSIALLVVLVMLQLRSPRGSGPHAAHATSSEPATASPVTAPPVIQKAVVTAHQLVDEPAVTVHATPAAEPVVSLQAPPALPAPPQPSTAEVATPPSQADSKPATASTSTATPLSDRRASAKPASTQPPSATSTATIPAATKPAATKPAASAQRTPARGNADVIIADPFQ